MEIRKNYGVRPSLVILVVCLDNKDAAYVVFNEEN